MDAVTNEIKIQTFALLIHRMVGDSPTDDKLEEVMQKAQRLYYAGRRAAKEA